MFYRKDEREARWKEDQVYFAELAHQYPCCDVPTLLMCLTCTDKASEVCPNKKELTEILFTL